MNNRVTLQQFLLVFASMSAIGRFRINDANRAAIRAADADVEDHFPSPPPSPDKRPSGSAMPFTGRYPETANWTANCPNKVKNFSMGDSRQGKRVTMATGLPVEIIVPVDSSPKPKLPLKARELDGVARNIQDIDVYHKYNITKYILFSIAFLGLGSASFLFLFAYGLTPIFAVLYSLQFTIVCGTTLIMLLLL